MRIPGDATCGFCYACECDSKHAAKLSKSLRLTGNLWPLYPCHTYGDDYKKGHESPCLDNTPDASTSLNRRKLNMLTIALIVPLLATAVRAICPGFNYGISGQIPLGNGISRCK